MHFASILFTATVALARRTPCQPEAVADLVGEVARITVP
jgi:hypothetical protein